MLGFEQDTPTSRSGWKGGLVSKIVPWMVREVLAEQGFCCCRIRCLLWDDGGEMVQKILVFLREKIKQELLHTAQNIPRWMLKIQ